ncbi:MAG: aminotransferase class III-fold pyridoxal phosphate-dependent enzyme [Planctomycetota bacterium]
MTPTSPAADSTQAIIDRHDTFMSINYGRYPLSIIEGEGCTLRDADGKTYLDLFAGFGAPVLGHCQPDLVDAVTEQAKKLWHVGNLFHTEPQTRAAQYISEMGFGGRSFFCHSGADANEAALKLARLYGKANPSKSTGEFGRYKVISCTKSFHGRSFATMGATANPAVREGFGPHLPGYTNVAYNDLDAIKAVLDNETVAIIAEPIQGEGGVNVPDPDYFKQLRALCDEHDLLLICDEVWTGCGRTGNFFAYQYWLDETSGEPDIMTLGKGVGGGLAVGVMCAQPRIAELYNAKTQGGVKHATTLGGNCLSMAVTARIFEVLQRDHLVEHAATLGDAAMDRLRSFAEAHPAVKNVRGRGLFIGVELDTTAEGAWFANAADVVNRCLDQGLLINAAQGNVLRLAPPVTITSDELHRGLDQLERVIAG